MMVDYSKQIKQFSDNKAVTAEREIMNGMQLRSAAKEFGYKDVSSMLATIMSRGVLPPLTRDERNCFQGQIQYRLPTNKDKARLAGQIGMSCASVITWGRGEYAPAPCAITAIAKALGCTRDELLSPVKECIGATKHSVKKKEVAETIVPTEPTIPEEAIVEATETEDIEVPVKETIEAKPQKEAQAPQSPLQIIITKTACGEFADYEETQAQVRRVVMKLRGASTYTYEELFRFGEELQEVATRMA